MTPMFISLSEFLKAAGAPTDSAPSEEDRAPVGFKVEAQVIDLKARFERLQVVHDFKPGDIVQHKLGLETLKNTREDNVLMFLRKLDHDETVADLEIGLTAIKSTHTDIGDCLVMHIANSACVRIRVLSSNTLEPREIDLSAFTTLTEGTHTPE